MCLRRRAGIRGPWAECDGRSPYRQRRLPRQSGRRARTEAPRAFCGIAVWPLAAILAKANMVILVLNPYIFTLRPSFLEIKNGEFHRGDPARFPRGDFGSIDWLLEFGTCCHISAVKLLKSKWTAVCGGGMGEMLDPRECEHKSWVRVRKNCLSIRSQGSGDSPKPSQLRSVFWGYAATNPDE